ncbi:MAG: preprotein translocase subunit SecG [Chloroflexi bacterium]|nr:preprotein translocase subunit SecG [Chloroflexota bacterium]
MDPYLNIIQIIISITLIVIILLQIKGDTGGGVFGGAGVARTRRGLERTLYNVTIALAAIFLLMSFLSAFLGSRF